MDLVCSNIWNHFSRMALLIKVYAVADSKEIKTNSGIALTVDDVIANLKGHEDEYDAMVFACGDAVPVFQQNASKQYNIDLMDVIKNFGEKGKIMIGQLRCRYALRLHRNHGRKDASGTSVG